MATYTDDFQSYSAGDLAGQGPWVRATTTDSAMISVDTTTYSPNNVIKYAARSGSLNQAFDILSTYSWDNDQSAQLTVVAKTGNGAAFGVCARCSVASDLITCYIYAVLGSNFSYYKILYKIVAGTYTILASAPKTTPVIANGDIIKLVVSGTSIKCYLNGSLDSNMEAGQNGCTGTGGDYVDSSISSGVPGMYTRSNGGIFMDSFLAEGKIDTPAYTYSGVLYIWDGANWTPRPMEINDPGFTAHPVYACITGGKWSLIQSF